MAAASAAARWCMSSTSWVVWRDSSHAPSTKPPANSTTAAAAAASQPVAGRARRSTVGRSSNPWARSARTVRSSSARCGGRSRGSASIAARSAGVSSSSCMACLRLRLQQAADRAARVEELTLRCAHRDLQLPADFLVRESLDVVEHEHRAVAVGEPRDRALEVDALGIAYRPGAQLQAVVDLLRAGARPLPQRLARQVESDRREPRAQARLPAELRKLAHRADPGLLH